jgi:hypothetical protein
MATKSFKIGEYAIGGIIKVNVDLTTITIQALDYYSKNVVSENTFDLDDDSYWGMLDYLNELTSSYYADKVMEYIKKTSNISHQIFRKY